MTGFGAASAASNSTEVRVEVRSVNHRFLQVKVRAGAELAELEAKLESLVKDRLSRGSVSLNVRVESAAGADAVELDRGRLERYRRLVDELGGELGVDPKLSLEAWLQLPGLMSSERGEESREEARGLALDATREALDALVAMREREGTAMADDLRANATELTRLRAAIEDRAPKLVSEHFEALRARVAELLSGSDAARTVDDASLARELALIADKGDISEEIVRLGAHLVELERLLAAGGARGRQLDFLVQEMLREVNTIGSKCSDAETAHLVVDAKTAVERLREQVQNVE